MEDCLRDGFSVPEIEQAAISAMLQFEPARTEAAANLKPEYFFEQRHKAMFNAIMDDWNSGRELDLVLFTQRLRDQGKLEMVGGISYVTSTYSSVCHSPAVMPFYVDRILEEHERRKCVVACSNSIESAPTTPDVLSETIVALSEIPVRRLKEASLRDAVQSKFDRLESGEPDADIVATGIRSLDEKSPLRRGDMPLIVGERKAGKSILALSIAENVAGRSVPVLYFSLEDREPKVVDRLFAGISRIPMDVNHVKKMSDAQAHAAAKATTTIKEMALTIRDDVYDLVSICALSKQMHARGKADLIIVDYAQLVRAEAKERRAEVEKVSRDLRLLAMELETPLILLCQLNKEGETRESKALEMDATAAWQLDCDEDNPNKRWLRVPWQRNGESGIAFAVTFLGNIARVEDYVPEPTPTPRSFRDVKKIMSGDQA